MKDKIDTVLVAFISQCEWSFIASGGVAPPYLDTTLTTDVDIVQELCESRGGRPGLSVLTSLLVSVDVKLY